MASRDKLLERARNNQTGIRFDEVVRLLWAFGYHEVRVTGSHHHFHRAGSRC
ncbi:MAG: type II toxin-antitoxin system HicA family toxin [Armatimonadetes bacterium]|nr:type II toxin-antitoxin system HicA family toxin [Armatimonadota bacterium]